MARPPITHAFRARPRRPEAASAEAGAGISRAVGMAFGRWRRTRPAHADPSGSLLSFLATRLARMVVLFAVPRRLAKAIADSQNPQLKLQTPPEGGIGPRGREGKG
jgi:hypothetical protein